MDEVILPFNESLSFQCLNIVPSPELQKSLAQAEVQFLYSTQFFAEINGEAALEHLRTLTYRPTKQNKIIDMQIKDELVHVNLIKAVLDKTGKDELADGFAKGYIRIFNAAENLSEKVFVFQIMTEAISSGYLYWRLKKINNEFANAIDKEIYNDEIRHLKMGKSLLQMCEVDEVKNSLSFDRRRVLVREMSTMCASHFSENIKRILKAHGLESHFNIRVTDLDKTVAKVILGETKAITESLVSMTGYA